MNELDSLPNRSAPPGADLLTIYQALKRGQGREAVTDDNVDALIEMARANRELQLEALLREWRAGCSSDPEMPVLPPRVPPR